MADSERWYMIGDKEYPSVTTVLGAALSKSFLIDWVVEGLQGNIERWLDANPGQRPDIVQLREQRDSEAFLPARIGDVVHDLIHQSIRNPDLAQLTLDALGGGKDFNPTFFQELAALCGQHELDIDAGTNRQQVFNCLTAWHQWCADYDVTVKGGPGRFHIVESEHVVYVDPETKYTIHPGTDFWPSAWFDVMPYAGTVDLVLEDTHHPDRMRYIIDIKTGKLQKEHLYQVAAYAYAYEWMQTLEPPLVPHVGRCFLLHLDRDDLVKRRYDLKESRPWRDIMALGFAPALRWFWEYRKHTPGRFVTPAKFCEVGSLSGGGDE